MALERQENRASGHPGLSGGDSEAGPKVEICNEDWHKGFGVGYEEGYVAGTIKGHSEVRRLHNHAASCLCEVCKTQRMIIGLAVQNGWLRVGPAL